MVIEILNAGEILVKCKFKLNKNLILNLYREIPRNSNPIKILIRLCTVRYWDILFSPFWLVDWNLPSIQDFDYHLIQYFEFHLPRNGLYHHSDSALTFFLYSFLAVSEIFNHSDTCAVPSVCNAVGLLTQALPRLHLSSAADDKKIVSYLHIHLFSNVLHRRRRVSPRRPMYLLIVGSHYCVMRFAYALQWANRILSLFPACTLSFSSLL